jgi:hypothetical protein
MTAREKAALLAESLTLLQARHGSRFGQGEKVELFHALSDLRRLADDLAAELPASTDGAAA